MFDRNIHRSRRLTAAHAYLRLALTERRRRFARARDEGALEGSRAVGVEYRRARTSCRSARVT